jgi:DNA-binding NarL/FixJ family response regulator
MITVLLVNDEAIVREGLRMRLALEADITIWLAVVYPHFSATSFLLVKRAKIL